MFTRLNLCFLLTFLVFAIGCKEPQLSSDTQVAAFDIAGPITPQVDMDQLLSAKDNRGIYEVGIGDVLEIHMPSVLTDVSPKLYKEQQAQIQPYLCRISDAGTIALPMLGQMNVEGKTLAEIEYEIVRAYYPKYIIEEPSVVCNVKEYHFKDVTVVGAVVSPGVYKLQSNEMSLVNALMKAGGIVEGGASLITIKNPKRKYSKPKQLIEPAPTSSPEVNEIKYLAELDNGVNEKYIEYIGESAKTNPPTPIQKEEAKETAKNESDYSNLQVDMIFRPQGTSQTQGTLIIQSGQKNLYSKNIDITNAIERAEYIKGLENVIGAQQAAIVGQALGQLASQFSVTKIATAENFEADNDELFDTANDLSQDSAKDCPGCNQKNSLTNTGNEVKFVPIDNAPIVPVNSVPISNAVINQNVNRPNEVNYVEPALEPRYSAAPRFETPEGIILPVKGLNIPFADVPLMEGDLIEVTRLNPQVFTVIGLVKAGGAFPYPSDVQYNLMQSIAFAGGIDPIADPRFVTVYRQDSKGEVVSAVFRIDKDFMAKSYNVKIKPGDLISVDITPRTKRNVLLNQIIRINFGLFINPFDLND